MTSMIYLARPIDFADESIGRAMNAAGRMVAQMIQKSGHVLYEPARAFTVGKGAQPQAFINDVNNTALMGSAVVVALWPSGAKSWGLPAEVGIAATVGIPVILVHVDKLSWAAQYNNVIPVSLDQNSMFWSAKYLGPVVDCALALAGGAEVEDIRTKLDSESLEHWLEDGVKVPAHPVHDYGPVVVNKNDVGQLLNLNLATVGNLDTSKLDKTPSKTKLPVKHIKSPWAGQLPSRAHDDDAGLDLYVSERVIVQPGQFVDVPTNVGVHLPEGTWGYLTGRSSTLRKKHLLVNPGVIDAGYTGELFSGVWNLGVTPVVLEPGDRVAQLVVLPNLTETLEPVIVEEFESDGTRGERGFGSSGV